MIMDFYNKDEMQIMLIERLRSTARILESVLHYFNVQGSKSTE